MASCQCTSLSIFLKNNTQTPNHKIHTALLVNFHMHFDSTYSCNKFSIFSQKVFPTYTVTYFGPRSFSNKTVPRLAAGTHSRSRRDFMKNGIFKISKKMGLFQMYGKSWKNRLTLLILRTLTPMSFNFARGGGDFLYQKSAVNFFHRWFLVEKIPPGEIKRHWGYLKK